MSRHQSSGRAIAWKAALLQGVLSGTVSTLVITLGAREIGRARALDWMEIGTVILRANSVRAEPQWWNVAAGIFVHQAADLAWAVVFFALLRRWTVTLAPSTLLLVSLPWAVVTSAVEYDMLLPRLQPLVNMQVPYWTALGVHVTSGLLYPFYPNIRAVILAERAPWTGVSRALALGLAGVVAALLALEVLARADRVPRWPLQSAEVRDDQQRFIHHMTAHHEMGVELAKLAAAHAIDDRLNMLGRLMVANQQGELRILAQWWRSWIGGSIPELSPAEQHAIPGMPTPETMAALAEERGRRFDEHFIDVMVAHHRGAIEMADEAWDRAADPRVRLFADSVRHAQRGQIDAMLETEALH
jgi:uncharacterized protein (DUF305 family)